MAKEKLIKLFAGYIHQNREYIEDYYDYLTYTNAIFKDDPFEQPMEFSQEHVKNFIIQYQYADKKEPNDNILELVKSADEEKLMELGYTLCAIKILESLAFYLGIAEYSFIINEGRC